MEIITVLLVLIVTSLTPIPLLSMEIGCNNKTFLCYNKVQFYPCVRVGENRTVIGRQLRYCPDGFECDDDADSDCQGHIFLELDHLNSTNSTISDSGGKIRELFNVQLKKINTTSPNHQSISNDRIDELLQKTAATAFTHDTTVTEVVTSLFLNNENVTDIYKNLENNTPIAIQEYETAFPALFQTNLNVFEVNATTKDYFATGNFTKFNTTDATEYHSGITEEHKTITAEAHENNTGNEYGMTTKSYSFIEYFMEPNATDAMEYSAIVKQNVSNLLNESEGSTQNNHIANIISDVKTEKVEISASNGISTVPTTNQNTPAISINTDMLNYDTQTNSEGIALDIHKLSGNSGLEDRNFDGSDGEVRNESQINDSMISSTSALPLETTSTINNNSRNNFTVINDNHRPESSSSIANEIITEKIKLNLLALTDDSTKENTSINSKEEREIIGNEEINMVSSLEDKKYQSIDVNYTRPDTGMSYSSESPADKVDYATFISDKYDGNNLENAYASNNITLEPNTTSYMGNRNETSVHVIGAIEILSATAGNELNTTPLHKNTISSSSQSIGSISTNEEDFKIIPTETITDRSASEISDDSRSSNVLVSTERGTEVDNLLNEVNISTTTLKDKNISSATAESLAEMTSSTNLQHSVDANTDNSLNEDAYPTIEVTPNVLHVFEAGPQGSDTILTLLEDSTTIVNTIIMDTETEGSKMFKDVDFSTNLNAVTEAIKNSTEGSTPNVVINENLIGVPGTTTMLNEINRRNITEDRYKDLDPISSASSVKFANGDGSISSSEGEPTFSSIIVKTTQNSAENSTLSHITINTLDIITGGHLVGTPTTIATQNNEENEDSMVENESQDLNESNDNIIETTTTFTISRVSFEFVSIVTTYSSAKYNNEETPTSLGEVVTTAKHLIEHTRRNDTMTNIFNAKEDSKEDLAIIKTSNNETNGNINDSNATVQTNTVSESTLTIDTTTAFDMLTSKIDDKDMVENVSQYLNTKSSELEDQSIGAHTTRRVFSETEFGITAATEVANISKNQEDSTPLIDIMEKREHSAEDDVVTDSTIEIPKKITEEDSIKDESYNLNTISSISKVSVTTTAMLPVTEGNSEISNEFNSKSTNTSFTPINIPITTLKTGMKTTGYFNEDNTYTVTTTGPAKVTVQDANNGTNVTDESSEITNDVILISTSEDRSSISNDGDVSTSSNIILETTEHLAAYNTVNEITINAFVTVPYEDSGPTTSSTLNDEMNMDPVVTEEISVTSQLIFDSASRSSTLSDKETSTFLDKVTNVLEYSIQSTASRSPDLVTSEDHTEVFAAVGAKNNETNENNMVEREIEDLPTVSTESGDSVAKTNVVPAITETSYEISTEFINEEASMSLNAVVETIKYSTEDGEVTNASSVITTEYSTVQTSTVDETNKGNMVKYQSQHAATKIDEETLTSLDNVTEVIEYLTQSSAGSSPGLVTNEDYTEVFSTIGAKNNVTSENNVVEREIEDLSTVSIESRDPVTKTNKVLAVTEKGSDISNGSINKEPPTTVNETSISTSTSDYGANKDNLVEYGSYNSETKTNKVLVVTEITVGVSNQPTAADGNAFHYEGKKSTSSSDVTEATEYSTKDSTVKVTNTFEVTDTKEHFEEMPDTTTVQSTEANVNNIVESKSQDLHTTVGNDLVTNTRTVYMVTAKDSEIVSELDIASTNGGPSEPPTQNNTVNGSMISTIDIVDNKDAVSDEDILNQEVNEGGSTFKSESQHLHTTLRDFKDLEESSGTIKMIVNLANGTSTSSYESTSTSLDKLTKAMEHSTEHLPDVITNKDRTEVLSTVGTINNITNENSMVEREIQDSITQTTVVVAITDKDDEVLSKFSNNEASTLLNAAVETIEYTTEDNGATSVPTGVTNEYFTVPTEDETNKSNTGEYEFQDLHTTLNESEDSATRTNVILMVTEISPGILNELSSKSTTRDSKNVLHSSWNEQVDLETKHNTETIVTASNAMSNEEITTDLVDGNPAVDITIEKFEITTKESPTTNDIHKTTASETYKTNRTNDVEMDVQTTEKSSGLNKVHLNPLDSEVTQVSMSPDMATTKKNVTDLKLTLPNRHEGNEETNHQNLKYTSTESPVSSTKNSVYLSKLNQTKDKLGDVQNIQEDIISFTSSVKMENGYTTESVLHKNSQILNTSGSDFICKTSGRFPDPKNCSIYHECLNLSTKYLHVARICLSGTLYDRNMQTCTTKPVPCPESCTSSNELVDPTDCNRYYKCFWGSLHKTFFLWQFKCPPRMGYDAQRNECVNATLLSNCGALSDISANGEESSYNCVDGGRFPMEYSCDGYYECKEKKGTFQMKVKTCSKGKLFDRELGVCRKSDLVFCPYEYDNVVESGSVESREED